MRHDVSPATTQMTKKDSNNAASPLSYHPDIMSPGMEAIYNGDQGKEVVPQPPEQYAHYQEGEKFPVYPNQQPEQGRRRICGMTVPLCLVLLVFLIIVLALGLGLGLGLGLENKFVENYIIEKIY